METVIDWSGAPEDCIGALVAKVGNCHFPKVIFAKFVIHEKCRVTGLSCDGTSLCAYTDVWLWEDRPWTGEGLPPVGTVCEVLWNESRMEYLRTKVFGANEHGQPIHRFDEGPKKYEYQADVLVTTLGNKVFRPIRTPEQIAAEERESAIKEMVNACQYSGSECTKIDCAALYDAGYRKQAGADVIALLERVLTLRGTLEMHGLLGDVEAALAKAKQVAP